MRDRDAIYLLAVQLPPSKIRDGILGVLVAAEQREQQRIAQAQSEMDLTPRRKLRSDDAVRVRVTQPRAVHRNLEREARARDKATG